MSKFKVGDVVKVAKDPFKDGIKDMVGEIVCDNKSGFFGVEFKENIGRHSCNGLAKLGHGFYVREDNIELLERTKPIIIYRSGKEVVALNKNTGEKGVAKCSPSDEFDFNIGAKIAFDRLIGCEKAEEKKQYMNCRFCVTDCDKGAYLTVGNIYDVKDGFFVADDRTTYPLNSPFVDERDMRLYFRSIIGDRDYAKGHFYPTPVHFVIVVE